MLIGSQLKNAQIEIVATLGDLPAVAVDAVVGRIMYVRNLGQLFIYDDGTPSDSVAGWKPINTAEDSLALLTTQSALITGGSGLAAPTRDVNAINTDVVTNIASIIANAANIVDITDGSDSIIANKTPPQEMCHTWNLNGNLSARDYGWVDGFWQAPFNCEITGFSMTSSSSSGDYVEVDLESFDTINDDVKYTCFSTLARLDGLGGFTPYAGSMYVSYLNETTGAMEVTNAEGNGGVGVNSDKRMVASVYPIWTGSFGMDSVDKGVRIACSIDATNMNGSCSNLSIHLYFRRLNFT